MHYEESPERSHPSRVDRVDLAFVTILALAASLIWKITALNLVLVVLPFAYAWLRFDRIPKLLLHAGPLLLLPAFAIASALWSVRPSASLYYGTQYFLTVLGAVLIGFIAERRALLLGLFFGFAVVTAYSLVTGILSGDIPDAIVHHYVFLGVTASKNAFGDLSALSGMMALAAFFTAYQMRHRAIAFSAAAIVATTFLFIYLSRSAGAVVAFALGVMTIFALTFVQSMSLKARIGFGALAAFLLLLLAATSYYWMDDLFADMLKVAGKNASLTGRTYIWERAEVEMTRHPIFGVGYGAFWSIGNLEAEAIWRAMFIQNRTGFNFHNTLLEIQVHLGIVGVILFSVTVLAYAGILFLRTYLFPEPTAIFFCAICIYEVARMQYESIALWAFNYSTIIFFAALAYAARPAIATTFQLARSPNIIGLRRTGYAMQPSYRRPVDRNVRPR